MIKNDTANGNKEFSEITADGIKPANPAISEFAGKKEISADFRETLRKSGLAVSEFENAEKDIVSDEFFSVNAENNRPEFAETGFSQNFGNPPKDDKKFLKRFGKWRHLTVIAGIAVVIALQSAFQFSLIGNENSQVFEDLSRNEVTVESEQRTIETAEIPEIEQVPETVKVSEIKEIIEENREVSPENIRNEREISVQMTRIAPKKQRQSVDTPLPPASRKKEQRASTAARLRRAEKILTGV